MKRYRDVVAVDFQPGDPSVVHHANIFVDYGGRGRELDAADPGPGFSVFGTGGFMACDDAGAIGGWAPGADPYQLPEGFGMGLPGGGDVVVEIHYHLNGKETLDQSSVAFYYADEPVERYVDGFVIGQPGPRHPGGRGSLPAPRPDAGAGRDHADRRHPPHALPRARSESGGDPAGRP